MALRIENPIETMVGAAVLAAAAFFAYFAAQAGGGSIGDGYRVNAAFSSATGVSVGTDVRIAGVKVGRVSAIDLDQDIYFANAELTLKGGLKLPSDSIAKISSEGLLGGTFIALEPGAEEEFLADGDSIEFTQPAADLLDLIQQFGGSSGGGEGAGAKAEPQAQAAPEQQAAPEEQAGLTAPLEEAASAPAAAPSVASPAPAAGAVEAAGVDQAAPAADPTRAP